jgi:exopolyphosphatase / guanosine-5'-triphosphate,3'-diphosphate pyrophosphatase
LRYAAIDIGSNAVRLLIAEINKEDKKISFKKNTLLRVPVRLGDDAFVDKKISKRKTEDLCKTMLAFRNLMDVYCVTDYMACATSALREAENGEEVVSRVKEFANVNINIVGGQTEARIIYSNKMDEYLDMDKNYLFVDVGGGSTELSVFSGGTVDLSRSFNLGTIRILDNQDKDETWQEMKEWIKQNVKKYKSLSAVGTGGNINKLFKMSEEKEGKPLPISKLRDLYNHLNSYSLKDRISVLGLNPDRADVIIPAAEIYLTVMKTAMIKQIYVPRLGLADGIIQLLIKKNLK